MQSLTEEQLREVLTRAEEIQHRADNASVDTSSELNTVLHAAEEAGLSRDAVIQALQERLGILGAPPVAGDVVFAKSTNGRFYAAEMAGHRGNGIRVRFIKGSEHTVMLEDLRPLTLLPGERIVCPWPNWGFWTSSVLSYDSKLQKVRATDNWGSEHTFDLDQIYMVPRDPSIGFKDRLLSKLGWGAIVMTALLGGAVGSLVTWLLTR